MAKSKGAGSGGRSAALRKIRRSMASVMRKIAAEMAAPRERYEPVRVEPMEPRLLLSASIQGTVFADLNYSGERDPGENGVAGWTVFLDENLNGQFDKGERQTSVDKTGVYVFSKLEPGFYDVGVLAKSGWKNRGEAGPIQTVTVVDRQLNAREQAEQVDAIARGQLVAEPVIGGVDFPAAVDFTIEASKKAGTNNKAFTFQVNAPGLKATDDWVIDWGDGKSAAFKGKSGQIDHTFEKEGLYTVQPTVKVGGLEFKLPAKSITVGDGKLGRYVPGVGYEFEDHPLKNPEYQPAAATASPAAKTVLSSEPIQIAASSTPESGGGAAMSMTTSAMGSVVAIQDAYVRGGGEFSDTNYGHEFDLGLKNLSWNDNYYTRQTYLKFDVSALANAPQVTLKLHVLWVDPGGENAVLNFVTVDSTNWSESDLRWSTAPRTGTAIDSPVTGTLQTDGTIEIDVTDEVTAALLTENQQLAIWISIAPGTADGKWIGFAARDHADPDLRPALIGQVQTPTIAITGPTTITPGIESEYTLTASSPAAADTTWWVDWGDGTNPEKVTLTGTSIDVQHIFPGTGPYQIRAIAWSNQGRRLDHVESSPQLPVTYADVVNASNPVAYWRFSEAPSDQNKVTPTVLYDSDLQTNPVPGAHDEVDQTDGYYVATGFWNYPNDEHPPMAGQSGWLFDGVEQSPAFYPSRVDVFDEGVFDTADLLSNGTISLFFHDNDIRDAALFSKDVAGNGVGQITISTKPKPGDTVSEDYGYIQVRIDDGSTVHTLSSITATDPDNDNAHWVTAGQWHHIAVSWGTGGLKLYIDGQLVAHDPDVVVGINGNNEVASIGASRTSTNSTNPGEVSNVLSGNIDEVALFATQLSDQAIRDQAFAESASLTVSTLGAVPFDLEEEGRFLTSDDHETANRQATLFTVPANPQALRIDFSGLSFDITSGNPDSINDAFEIALLDSTTGQPVVATIGADRDASFNFSQTQIPLLATGVALTDVNDNVVNTVTDAGSVYIDISSLTPGTQVQLVTRLLNNDGDTATQVTIKYGLDAVMPTTPDGRLLREYWLNIPGDLVSDLTTDSRYPDQPFGSTYVSSLQIGGWNAPGQTSELEDAYGQRVHGYLIAPETGYYHFWISSDDDSELWLSRSSDAAHATRVAYVAGATDAMEWDKYGSQRSIPIYLQEGQSYYIKLLQKETYGGDNLAVGWRKPSDGAGSSPAQVIPGSALSTHAINFTPAPTVRDGLAIRQYWTGISGGYITDLTNNSRYPIDFDDVDFLTSLQATSWSNPSITTDWADNYGQRIFGYIIPQTSGNYTFYIAGDDRCELRLSTDADSANLALIASVPNWTNELEWTKYPQQQSSTISLQAGQAYFYEILHKEGGGGDRLAVGWSQGGAITVVPGSVLSTYIPAQSASQPPQYQGQYDLPDGAVPNPVPDYPDPAPNPGPINFTALEDVTDAFTIQYAHTTYDTDTEQFFPGLTVQKTGSTPVAGRLLLALTNVSNANVQWLNPDGVTPFAIGSAVSEGTPYLEIGHLLTADAQGNYTLDSITTEIALKLHNPDSAAFTYNFVLLAETGEQPVGVTLTENSAFHTDNDDDTELGYKAFPLDIGNNNTLTIPFSNLSFGNAHAGEHINDAFELLLLDADGRSIVATIAPGSDAFFNLTETVGASLANGVTYDSVNGLVKLDVSKLHGQSVTLLARLINNDNDIASQVTLPVDPSLSADVLVTTPATPAASVPAPRVAVDFDAIDDVSAYISTDYQRTSFDEDAHRLTIDLTLTNDSAFAIRGPLLVALGNVTDRVTGAPTDAIRLDQPDGITPDGLLYLDLSSDAFTNADRVLGSGESVSVTVDILNPDRVQFNYDLTFLGQLNTAPAFTSDPYTDDIGNAYPVETLDGNGHPQPAYVEIVATPGGNTEFRYQLAATDREGDAVTYTILQGPDGLDFDPADNTVLVWTPQTSQAGSHSVRLRVADSPYGLYDPANDQTFTLRVVTGVDNRPPRFTSTPVVDAYVGQEYVYQAAATDPDGDDLYYTLVSVTPAPGTGGPGEAITLVADSTNEGRLTWTPQPGDVGKTFTVTLQADDTTNQPSSGYGSDTQTFEIYVNPATTSYKPDLTIAHLRTDGLTFDPQRLLVEGVIEAEVTNLGPGPVKEPFDILFFEDRDFDGVFDPTHDQILGSTTVDATLDTDESIPVAAAISGSVDFAGAHIWAFVDSGQVITEINESNNTDRSKRDCKNTQQSGSFTPYIKDDFSTTYDGAYTSPYVADINGDTIPDIVTMDIDLLAVVAFDGSTGNMLFSSPANWESEVALGDIDNDGHIEIIVDNGETIESLEYVNGALVRQISNVPVYTDGYRIIAPAIANVDDDPEAEIIVGSMVFEHDLTLKSQPNLPPDWISKGSNGWGPVSIVANIDSTLVNNRDDPELIVGNAVLRPDGFVVWYNDSVPDGYNAVADFGTYQDSSFVNSEPDSQAEVVLVANHKVILLNGENGSKIWETTFPLTGNTNLGYEGGPPTVADFDGDGALEIGVAASRAYFVFEADGTVSWMYRTQDQSSGITGSTVFDFEGDGKVEIVYGDELFLRVFYVPESPSNYDSETGIPVLDTKLEFSRPAGTALELPVVVDYDKDGNAEIVFVASFGERLIDSLRQWTGNPNATFDASNGLYVIGDLNDTWAPTRSIWNQHSYHITNVNDDGTIPEHEQSSWLASNTYRLNTILDPNFDPLDAPDLIPSYARTIGATGETTYTVRIGNAGNFFSPNGTLVAFYDGDPNASGTLLGTATLGRIDPGHYEDVTLTVSGTPVGDLWVVADDDGTGTGTVRECVETNNAYSLVAGLTQPTINIAPEITQLPSGVVEAGEAFAGAVVATDANGHKLLYELKSKPAGMTIDALTGEIIWTPTVTQRGNHRVIVRVSDGRGGVAVDSFSLTVTVPNQGPVITSEPVLTVQRGRTWNYQIRAYDPDSEQPVQLESVTGPAVHQGQGFFTWDTTGLDVGTKQTVTIVVRDAEGALATQEREIEVVAAAPNHAPQLLSEPRSEIGVGQMFVYRIEVADADNDPLTIQVVPELIGSNWLDWDGDTLTLSGTPQGANIGSNSITVTVNDGQGGLISQEFDILVTRQSGNTAPQIAAKEYPAATVGQAYRIQFEATDLEGDPTYWWLESSPDPSMVIDRETGELLWTPKREQVGTQEITVRVKDALGATSTATFPIEVRGVNTPPQIRSVSPVAGGSGFAYVIRAKDVDGDPITMSLTPGSDLQHGVDGVVFEQIDDETAILRWDTPTPGTFTVEVQAEDGKGGVDVQSFEITFTATAANQSPTVTPQPSYNAVAGQVYTYDFYATDPDGGAPTVTLAQKPGREAGDVEMALAVDSVDPTLWHLTWTPGVAHAQQSNTVVIEVQDAAGAKVTYRFGIGVRATANQPPQMVDGDQAFGVYDGHAFSRVLRVTDPDHDPLTFEVRQIDGSPVPDNWGVTIDNYGRISSTVNETARTVKVVVTDPYGGSDEAQITFNTATDSVGPVVTVKASTLSPRPGTTVRFLVTATDAGIGLADLGLTVNGQSIMVNSDGTGSYDVPSGAEPGSLLNVVATAVDAASNSSSSPLTLTVYQVPPAAPTVTIASPGQGEQVTSPTSVVGTITGGASVAWKVEAQPLAGGDAVTIAEGTGEVSNDELAVLDPTLLTNGQYFLIVTADNTPGEEEDETVATRTVDIQSNVKLGNFALSFTDLTVPVLGIPISVQRSYDTLRADQEGDFGYGWELGLFDVKLETDVQADANSFSELGLDNIGYGAPFRNGTRITITMPDGASLGFTARVEPIPSGMGGFAGGLFGLITQTYRLTFLPDVPGTQLTLTSPVDVTLNEYGEMTVSGLPYNPASFDHDYRLTTGDGTQYSIASFTGRLQNISDRLGHTLQVDGNGVYALDQSGTILDGVRIERDQRGRIIAVGQYDPATGGFLGDTVNYAYDVNGDLVAVTDRSDHTTTMAYAEGTFVDATSKPIPDHVLTSITDARDVKVLEVRYTINGRIERIRDASDASAGFEYTIDGPSVGLAAGYTVESVKDANDVPTELVRNGRGNTVRRVQRLSDGGTPGSTADDTYLVTVYEYGDAANPDSQTAVSESFQTGHADRFTASPTVWLSHTTYDAGGNVLTTTDAAGAVTRYGNYDRFGNPGYITDPLGNTTTNSYDNGNLTRTQDASGTVTDYTYDNGNLHQLHQYTGPNGTGDRILVASYDYDERGRLTAATDADPDGSGPLTSTTRHFVYDAAGNQTLSYYVWTDPASLSTKKTLVSRTDYDAEGRVERSRSYTITGEHTYSAASDLDSETADWSTSTDYNAVGQVETSIDRFGAISRTRYDLRGNVVETATQTTLQNNNPAWIVTRTFYDANGRAVATTDPLLIADASGQPGSTVLNPVTEADAGADRSFVRVTHTLYDALGRVVETRRLAGADIPVELVPIYSGIYESTFDDYNPETDTYDPAITVLTSSTTHYDSQGRVQYTVNHNIQSDLNDDARTDYYYDAGGRQTAVLGPVVTVVGLNSGNPVRSLTEYTYDASGGGRQTAVTTNIAITETTNLHPDITSSSIRLEADKQTTGFQYDALGRVTRTTYANGTFTSTTYDARGRRSAETDALGRRTDYAYDDAGRLLSVTLPAVDDATTPATDLVRPVYSYEYDAYGNQRLITDPIGTSTAGDLHDRETTFAYDHLNRQTSRTLPLGQVETTHYNDTPIAAVQQGATPESSVGGGQVEYQVDFEGRVTAYRYDNTPGSSGRLVGKFYYNTLAAYDADKADGSLTAAVRTVEYAYDALGRTRSVDDSGHGITTYQYDVEGRQTQVASPEGILNHHYNALGQLDRTWTSTDAGGANRVTETAYTYDALGRLATVTQTWRNTTNIADEVTGYTYDVIGNLDKQRGANGVVADYDYDRLNRLTQLTHFKDTNANFALDAGEWKVAQFNYTLDSAGNRLSAVEQFDADNDTGTGSGGDGLETSQTFTWEYDALNRLVAEQLGDDYLSPSQTTTDADTQGDWVGTYGQSGHFISQLTQQLPAGVEVDFSNAESGAWQSSTPDPRGLLKSSSDPDRIAPYWTNDNSFEFTVSGQTSEPRRITLYMVDWDNYNRGQRVEMLDAQTQEVLASYDVSNFTDGIYLTFDAPGNVTFRITHTAGINAVLSGIFIDPAPEGTRSEYAFDLASNRVHKSTANGEGFTTVTYAYDANDRLTQEVKDIAGTTAGDTNTVYAYDGTTQTGKTLREGTDVGSGDRVEEQICGYDVMGRMSVSTVKKYVDDVLDSTTTSTYTYDAQGVRVQQTTQADSGPVQTTNYLYDSNNHTGYAQVLEERDAAGTITKTYTLGHDVIAQQAPGVVGGDSLTFLYDGHGSTRALLDSAGLIATNPNSGGGGAKQLFTYDAYGNHLTHSPFAAASAALTNLLYSGELTDATTGLQYLRARYYDPASGRFTRLDPFAGSASDPLSLHKYLYTHANPVMGIDPSGAVAGVMGIGSGFLLLDLLASIAARVVAFAPYAAAVAIGGAAAYGAVQALGGIENIKSTAIEWLSTGSDVLGSAALVLLTQTQQVVKAIDDAISAAIKVGQNLQQLRKLRIFPIIKSFGPDIFAFDSQALAANPRWFILTYNGPLSARTALNRTWVYGRWGYLMAAAPPGYELDEFPYASVWEGGPPFALGKPVPATENRVQGGLLSAFYQYSLGSKAGSPFLVVPIPL